MSTGTSQAEIFKALQRSWRALLAGVDNEADHMAVLRATAHADRWYHIYSADERNAAWYATVINHYLDR